MSGPHSTTKIAAAFQALVAGFGLLGNALVIFVFAMGRDKQDTSAVIYILNLAVADFLYLFSVPFSISAEVTLEWIFGDAMCKFCALALYLNFLVSPLFLMVMSIDRCVSVYRAASSSTFRSTRIAKRISIGVWAVGLAIVLGPAMFHKVNYTDSQLPKCEPVFPGKPICDFQAFGICLSGESFYQVQGANITWTDSEYTTIMNNYVTDEDIVTEISTTTATLMNSTENPVSWCLRKVCPYYKPNSCMFVKSDSFRIWTYFSFVVNYFLPCAAIVICYAALLYHIYQPSAISTSTSSGGGMNEDRKKRATLVVALLVISYFVCFTPYYVWQVIMNVGVNVSSNTICSHVRRIITTLADLNSALNPILYPFIGSHFRVKLKLALRRLRRKTRNSQFGTINKLSLKRRRTDSNRNKTIRENIYNKDNDVIKDVDEQQLIADPLCDVKEEAAENRRSDNGQMNNGPGASTAHSASHKASAASETSSGCLSCFRNDSYVCPECILEKSDYENQNSDVIADENQPSVDDNEEKLREKLCKKHRNSEAQSTAVATAKHSRGRWRYASSIKSESKFATEVSSAGVNL